MTGIATWTAIIPSPLTTFTKCQDLYETNDLMKTKIRDRLFLTFYGKCFTLGSFLFVVGMHLKSLIGMEPGNTSEGILGVAGRGNPAQRIREMLCLERHHYFGRN